MNGKQREDLRSAVEALEELGCPVKHQGEFVTVEATPPRLAKGKLPELMRWSRIMSRLENSGDLNPLGNYSASCRASFDGWRFNAALLGHAPKGVGMYHDSTPIPRWPYDCDNCKFSWSCGPTCGCNYAASLHIEDESGFKPGHRGADTDMQPTPEKRRREVKRLVAEWRASREAS